MNGKKLIEDIANKLVKDFYKLDDYDIEGDEYGLDSISVTVTFDVGKCQVEGYYWYDRTRKERMGLEVNLYPENKHELPLVNEALDSKMDELFDLDDYKDAVLEKARDDNEDEWESHGFRDEADYLHWRYG